MNRVHIVLNNFGSDDSELFLKRDRLNLVKCPSSRSAGKCSPLIKYNNTVVKKVFVPLAVWVGAKYFWKMKSVSKKLISRRFPFIQFSKKYA